MYRIVFDVEGYPTYYTHATFNNKQEALDMAARLVESVAHLDAVFILELKTIKEENNE